MSYVRMFEPSASLLRRSNAVHQAIKLMCTRSADDGERTLRMLCFAGHCMHNFQTQDPRSTALPAHDTRPSTAVDRLPHGRALRMVLGKPLNVDPHTSREQTKQQQSRWACIAARNVHVGRPQLCLPTPM